MSSIKAQVRIDQRKRAERQADTQALVTWFAQHHPDILAKYRTESLNAANTRGAEKHWTPQQVTDDAWRHLIARLRFLKNEGAA